MVWFMSYRPDVKQLIGTVTLLVGAFVLILPKKLINIEYSVYLSLLFYLGMYLSF